MTLEALISSMELCSLGMEEAEQAAQIVKRDHSSYGELPLADYDKLVLPDLVRQLMLKPVIVGKMNGDIIAVYEVPEFFAREGKANGHEMDVIAFGQTKVQSSSPFGGFIYHGDSSHFATVRNDPEVLKAFFARFGAVLEQFAFAANALIINRMTITHSDVGAFSAVGYASVHVTPGLRYDVHVMEKAYGPRSHDLPRQEHDLVDKLQRLMSISLNTFPSDHFGQTI